MTQPGWFPDPGGQPGLYRYWDGAAWTQQLSAKPPGGPAGGQSGRSSGPLWGWIAGAVALLLVLAFLVPRLFGGASEPTPRRSVPTSSPTVSGWDETSRPSPTPTPTPTPDPPETALPCPDYSETVVDGRLYGGGLSAPAIDDRRWSAGLVHTLPWGICATGQRRSITAQWVSELILTGIQPAALSGTLAEQADAIAADSVTRFYEGGDGRFEAVSSGAATVGGLPAWELRYRVRIDYLGDIPGDNVNVLVVEHSDGSRSALLTFATIGDEATQKQVDRARAGVRVEKK